MTRKFLNLSKCFLILSVCFVTVLSGHASGPEKLHTFTARTLDYIEVYYSNSTSALYTIVFTNTSTSQEYFFQVNNGSGLLGYVLPGEYDITFTSNDFPYTVYDAGCDDSGNGFGTCSVTGVPITASCNNIGIYYYH